MNINVNEFTNKIRVIVVTKSPTDVEAKAEVIVKEDDNNFKEMMKIGGADNTQVLIDPRTQNHHLHPLHLLRLRDRVQAPNQEKAVKKKEINPLLLEIKDTQQRLLPFLEVSCSNFQWEH